MSRVASLIKRYFRGQNKPELFYIGNFEHGGKLKRDVFTQPLRYKNVGDRLVYADPRTGFMYIDANCPGFGEGDKIAGDELEKMKQWAKDFWIAENLSEEERIEIHKQLINYMF